MVTPPPLPPEREQGVILNQKHANCGCQRGPFRPTIAARLRARVSWAIGSFYRRHLYRHIMRLAHRFNWHHTVTLGPLSPGGEYQVWCQWCGLRQTVVPHQHERIAHV